VAPRRPALALALIAAGAVLAVAGVALVYAREAIVDRDAFADRAVEALRDPAVRRVVARELAAQGGPALGGARPAIESAVGRAIRSRAFEGAFRLAVLRTHAVLFGRDREDVVLDVEISGEALAAQLRSISPALAPLLPPGAVTRLLELPRSAIGTRALRLADDLAPAGPAALALGVLLLLAGLAVHGDPRAALVRAGIAVAMAALALVLALRAAEELAASQGTAAYGLVQGDVGPAVRAVWRAYAGDLQTWALAIAAAGLVTALAAALSRARL
jgi:hypothetical protein